MQANMMSDAEHDANAHAHPSELAYIRIAAALAVITALEVLVYYLESVGSFLVPVLVVLSAIKFYLVVSFFMHLKFDDKKLSWIFGFALMVAVAVFLGVWAMHHFDTALQWFQDMSLNPLGPHQPES